MRPNEVIQKAADAATAERAELTERLAEAKRLADSAKTERAESARKLTEAKRLLLSDGKRTDEPVG